MHRTSRTLYAYWNDTRGGRLAPRRFDIEPSRIAAILPETFVLEKEGDDYRYRLTGTAVARYFAADPRGENLLGPWPRPDRAALKRALGHVTSGAILVATVTAHARDGRSATLELLVLPLLHLGARVERYIGSLSAFQSSSWLGVDPIACLRLAGCDLPRPRTAPNESAGGEPASLAAPPERRADPDPLERRARIVQSGSRRFRVYDGGLAAEGARSGPPWPERNSRFVSRHCDAPASPI